MNYAKKFDNLLRTAGIESRDSLVKSFVKAIQDKDIDPYFSFICSGAFKEVYNLNDDYVIKFVSSANDTEGELSCISEAEEAGVGDIFLEEYSLKIDKVIFPENFVCNYIIVQRKISAPYHYALSNYTDLEGISKGEYMANPMRYTDGTIVPYSKARSCHVTAKEWMQDVIDYYGDEYFEAFVEFLYNYDVTDIHEENVGYTDTGRPVVFDWFSH